MSHTIPEWYVVELMNRRDDLIRELRRLETLLINEGRIAQRSVTSRKERRATTQVFCTIDT